MATPQNAWLSSLWLTDQATARAIVSDAIRSESGNVAKAARRLNVGKRTLFRWIVRHVIQVEGRAVDGNA